jgi:pantoate--beta-alanine ligase
MHVCDTKSKLRTVLSNLRQGGKSIGLVPTKGFLHEGHLTLVRRARAENDYVVASIFVNPTQFGNLEDLEKYPRDMERDLDLLRQEGVVAVFTPTPDTMYHPDAQTIVETTDLANVLMGELRPEHFRGVATVVTKLFNIFQPTRAYFGEKDYQQLMVIRTMARDLDIPVDICGVPTVREPDGLAMSSRNVRLTPEARKAAPIIAQALDAAQDWVSKGIGAQVLKQNIWDMIASEHLADVQSIDIQDAWTLVPVTGHIEKDIVILVAVQFEPVLLIDQRVITI